jgi:hypothetical protein
MSLYKSINVLYELLLLLLGELLLVDILNLPRARYSPMPSAQRRSTKPTPSSNFCICIIFSWL